MKRNDRTVCRIAPCPTYDVTGMECWLEDLAKEGLFLKQYGTRGPFFFFRRGKPETVTYRLLADNHDPSVGGYVDMLAGDGIKPDKEEREFNEYYGWEYVSDCGRFFIYRTTAPHPRELETDPQVQAIAIRAARQWELASFCVALVIPLLYYRMWCTTLDLYGLVSYFPVFTLCSIVTFLWVAGYTLYNAIQYERLRRRLDRGQALDHRTGSRKRTRRHGVLRLVTTLLVILWLVCFFFRGAENRDHFMENGWHCPSDLPFPSLSEVIPQARDVQLEARSTWSRSNPHYTQWMHYAQSATVTNADGEEVELWYAVSYFKARAAWYARWSGVYEQNNVYWRDGVAKPIPDLPEANIAVYNTEEIGDTDDVLLIQQGKECILVHLYQRETRGIPLEDWVPRFVEGIRDN